jgi:hypothetical protein
MLRLDCDFCKEFVGDSENSFHRIYSRNPDSRVLLRSDEFAVIPSLGQILEGYLLVLPIKHFKALGDLSGLLLEEFAAVSQCVGKILREQYGPCIRHQSKHGSRSDKYTQLARKRTKRPLSSVWPKPEHASETLLSPKRCWRRHPAHFRNWLTRPRDIYRTAAERACSIISLSTSRSLVPASMNFSISCCALCDQAQPPKFLGKRSRSQAAFWNQAAS